MAWFGVRRQQFTLLSGHPAAYRSSEPVTRTFCVRCGTQLGYQHRDRPEDIEVTICTLDEPEAIRPDPEIWLSHKVSWAASEQSLPHFSKDGPETE